MPERLSGVERRIVSIHELSSVVTAIRGIAAARLREADAQLAGIRSYAETVGEAIGQVLALLNSDDHPRTPGEATGPGLVIALCSEQGFVGGFNSRVLDHVAALMTAQGHGASRLFVVGDRGVMIAGERDIAVEWSMPMATSVDDVTCLANRLAEALYEQLAEGILANVTIVHAIPDQGSPRIVSQALIPFDFERFPHRKGVSDPILNLGPERLVARLAEEYVFAELCEATMLSFAAENEARMWAMLSAHENVERRLGELSAAARQIRQEEITSEVVELAAGVDAGAVRVR